MLKDAIKLNFVDPTLKLRNDLEPKQKSIDKNATMEIDHSFSNINDYSTKTSEDREVCAKFYVFLYLNNILVFFFKFK